MKCMVKGCEQEIDPRRDWRQVLGFEQQRTGGGTHALALREVTGHWMCNGCMTDHKAGIDIRQRKLL